MEYVMNVLLPQVLVLIAPVFLAVLTAVIVWAATQVATILKTKWNIEIDVAALRAQLAEADIDKLRQENLHSAIKTGVAQIIGDIETTQSASAGEIRLPPNARAVIMGHLVQSIPETMRALSPLPDVIDNLAIRFAKELIAQRRRS